MMRGMSQDGSSRAAKQWTPWSYLAIASCVFAGICFYIAWNSKGFLEADGIYHSIRRRYALENWTYFVDVWTRPMCVMVSALPSYLFGLMGTRMTSCGLAIAGAWLTYRTAAKLGIARPEIAGLLLLGQPLLIAHAASEMTELTFMVLLVGMLWAYVDKRFWLLALLAALGPLARPEGFGFLAVVGVGLLLHRRWLEVLILPMGLLIWSYAGWVIFGRPGSYPWWEWIGKNWPYSGESAYKPGPIWHFMWELPVVVGAFALPFMWIGCGMFLRGRNWTTWWKDHDARCQLIVAGLALGILVGHSLLYWKGLMASAGLVRYLIIVGPMFAMMGCAGLEWFCEWMKIGRVRTIAAVGALSVVVIHATWPALPVKMLEEDRLSIRVAERLKSDEKWKAAPKWMVSLPRVFLELDEDPLRSEKILFWSQEMAVSAPVGTLMVWDNIYGQHNALQEMVLRESFLKENGWVEDERIVESPGEYEKVAVVFRKVR
jgi:hypothetical protein